MSEEKKRPFGLRDKLGYMFGDFGNDFTFIFSSMLLMKFYSDVMGIDTALIGTMMMVARFVDAFTDITMGQLADRSRPNRKGKFLKWILYMCVPVALSSFLMYATWFRTFPLYFRIFWMFFTYILWGSIFYTSINIPYGSMASAISPEPKHRAELSNFRSIGAALAGMIIGVVLPLIVFYKDENGNEVLSGKRVTLAALLCSVGAVVCYLLCYSLITERVEIKEKTEPFSFGRIFAGLIKNKALLGIVAATVCILLVQLTLSQMVTYIFPNYFRNTTAQSVAGLIGVIITLICAAFTVKLSEKFGRKALAIMSSLFGGAVFLVAFLIKTENAWFFVFLYALSYVGLAVFSLICWAMITDVIDDTEVQTGSRDDGTIYAVYSFSRKLGQALSSGVTGYLLKFIGYTQETAFDENVTRGIYDITCLVPAVGYILLSLVLYFLYPLTKQRVNENSKVLKERKSK